MSDTPVPPTGRQSQSWTSGAKDAVVASLTGRVWACLGQGIVNEVFWPAVDQPQVRDFGFLLNQGPRWREVKAVDDYVLSLPDDPAVPLVTVTHRGDFSTLELRVVPDPHRDALLVGYAVSGAPDVGLYPLLAPHLGSYTAASGGDTGTDNSAWVQGGALFASDPTGHVLCLTGDPPFSRTSVGYVGYSDGWTDFAMHQAMTWQYTSAGPGVVALMGELQQPAGTLALGFGATADEALAAALGALAAGIDSAADAITAQWQERASTLTFPSELDGLSADLAAAVRRSATVLRCCEDNTTGGGIVAALATPWGDTANDPGGYHLVWCRDGGESALAMAALGDLDTGRRLLGFLARVQRPDGSWARCCFLDGSALPGLQLDETAFPILLAAKLTELGAALPDGAADMIRRAAGFLAQNGPVHGQDAVDRWEETPGGSPFTLGLIVVALVAAAQSVTGEERDYLLSLADNWNERIEEFSYLAGDLIDRAYDVTGHYVRVGPAADIVRVGNQLPPGLSLNADLMVGMEFLYLPRLGLRDAADQRILDTVRVVERMLARQTTSGVGYTRYDLDGYGEWLDGSGWPVRGFGIGRPWPLLAGERGHFEAVAGRDAHQQLDAMLAMRGRGGLLPEQAWDAGDLPWRRLANGGPTASAMPLAWAHSELIKLAVTASTGQGRPVERLAVVDARYAGTTPTSTIWHWRSNGPVAELPPGCTLTVEDTVPFTLHYGLDGWQPATISERTAQPRPFAIYAVSLTPDELAGHSTLQFTRRYAERWEGQDHAVQLDVPRPATRALPLPTRETAGRPPHRPRR